MRTSENSVKAKFGIAPVRSSCPRKAPDTSRMYQGFLMYTIPQTYIRNPAAHDRRTANRKRKSRVAGPWRGGVRWRPGLTDNQIVLPRRTSVYAAHQLFFKGAYAMIGVRGNGGSSGNRAI